MNKERKERYKYTHNIDDISAFDRFSNVEKSIDVQESVYKDIDGGYELNIPKGMKCQGVIKVDLNYPTGNDYCVRNKVMTYESSEVRLVIQHHKTEGVRIKSYLEIDAAANSRIDVIEIVDTYDAILLDEIKITQESYSNVTLTILDINNRQVIRNQYVDLNGQNSECSLNGLYIPTGDEKVDNYIKVRHVVPNCVSNQLYKGIMMDRSRAAFTGHILVEKDAQKTAAYQQNQNIVLTDTAMVNTRPQLEIYADDVKCSHGATVGNLDEEATYYMRQRGITEKEAKKLQIIGFGEDVLSGLDESFEDIVDLIEKKITKKLEVI